jgi:hypothetical protein
LNVKEKRCKKSIGEKKVSKKSINEKLVGKAIMQIEI